MVGDTAYVADRNQGLRIFDVAAPAHPTQIGCEATFSPRLSSAPPRRVECPSE